jgi:DNA-binding transcriptional ArsR family regulator
MSDSRRSTTTRSSKVGRFPATRLTAVQFRVLAHPLRSRLLQALRRRSPATATELARELGTNTGATSYHLRQLAEVGLVVEHDRSSPGRERWWRAAHDSHGWVESEVVDGPDTRAAVDWMMGYDLRVFVETAEACLAARAHWPQQWRAAVSSIDIDLELTPRELAALNREVIQILQRYRHPPAASDRSRNQRQPVRYFTHALPQLTAER